MNSGIYLRIIVLITILLCSAMCISLLKVDVDYMKKSIFRNILIKINRHIRRQDAKLQENLFKNRMTFSSKYNTFLQDLKIDLDFLRKVSLSQFKFILYFLSLLVAILICYVMFNNIFLIIFMWPIAVFTVICFLFSKSINNKHRRIVDVIEAENLLSPEIKRGFNNAVRDNINGIPISIRSYYQEYLNNVSNFNYSTEQAIEILKLSLGRVSFDFLSKVNVQENYREDGFIEVFNDTVDINNIKRIARRALERTMRNIFASFMVAITMSYGLMVVEVLLMKFMRWFYFSFFVGQILLVLDILLLLLIYLRMNMMRSEEL